MRRFQASRRGDVRRMAEAISAPGIDPRMWCTYATVDDDPDAIAIEEGGVFIDVHTQPGNRPLTCRYAGVYAAPGGAIFFPIRRGDEVLVFITNGDENEGPVAYPRMHNDIDRFPLTVNGREVDGTFPFVKLEQGDWELEVAGTIRMQGSDAREAARKGDPVRVTVPIGTFLTAAQNGVLNATPVDIDGEITGGSVKVKIGG